MAEDAAILLVLSDIVISPAAPGGTTRALRVPPRSTDEPSRCPVGIK